jgi:hypothetical protein
MKRTWTLFEIIISAALLLLGLYMLQEGISNTSARAPAIVIGGALFFTIGVMALVSAVKSILWHRSMLRDSMPHDDPETFSPQHNRGS